MFINGKIDVAVPDNFLCQISQGPTRVCKTTVSTANVCLVWEYGVIKRTKVNQ